MEPLHDFTPKTGHQEKDKRKFACCTKLITDGKVGSSSREYWLHLKAYNPEALDMSAAGPDDIVGISVNGQRTGRLSFHDWHKGQVEEAIRNGVEYFVLDKPIDRSRNFNIGEREAADYLRWRGFKGDRHGHFLLNPKNEEWP